MEMEKDIKADMPSDMHKSDMTADIESSPPPYSSVSGAQTLEVHYGGWRSSSWITDSSGQKLFTALVQGSRSELEILDRNNLRVGHTKCSSLTSKITVEMANGTGLGPAFEMHNTLGVLGGSPKYSSPAFGDEMVWRNKALSSKIIYELFDSRGTSLARFQSNTRTKVGRLELGDVVGEDRINELAVTLITLLHRKLRQIEQATLVAIAS